MARWLWLLVVHTSSSTYYGAVRTAAVVNKCKQAIVMKERQYF
jgi:hypothetical protein